MELRIALLLDVEWTAAFNWVTLYNLSRNELDSPRSCFNPVFSLRVFANCIAIVLLVLLRRIPDDYLARNCYKCCFVQKLRLQSEIRTLTCIGFGTRKRSSANGKLNNKKKKKKKLETLNNVEKRSQIQQWFQESLLQIHIYSGEQEKIERHS